MLRVHVANPNGHGLKLSWAEYGSDEVPPVSVTVRRSVAEYPLLDDQAYVAEIPSPRTNWNTSFTSRPWEKWTAEEQLTVCFEAEMGNGEYRDAMIPLDLNELVPAKAFAGNGLKAEVSPLGLYLTFDARPEEEVTVNKLTVRYTDGSAFTVLDEHTVNLSVSSADWKTWDQWMAFNRLVNADAIAEIRITTSDGENVLIPAA